MRITPLKQLVEEYNIGTIEVDIGTGVAPVSFSVDSPDYREQKEFLVKGDYTIREDQKTMTQVLRVERLEKELEVTINPYEVKAEEAIDPRIEEHINTEVTALVFHRGTLDSAGREMPRKFVPNWIDAVLESFRKKTDQTEIQLQDFGIIEIEWSTKTVTLKSIAPKESDTMEEEQSA